MNYPNRPPAVQLTRQLAGRLEDSTTEFVQPLPLQPPVAPLPVRTRESGAEWKAPIPIKQTCTKLILSGDEDRSG